MTACMRNEFSAKYTSQQDNTLIIISNISKKFVTYIRRRLKSFLCLRPDVVAEYIPEEGPSGVLYFDEHRHELVQRYPDRWVAIYDKQVVGAAKALPRLISQLERKGIPRGRAFVDFTTEREELLILFA